MSSVAAGTVVSVTNFTTAQLAAFQPTNVAREMRLAQALVAPLPLGSPVFDALVPAAVALGEKYDVRGMGLACLTSVGRELYRENVRTALRPHFDKALSKASATPEAKDVVSQFVDDGFSAVQFDALAEAGLVTHEIASGYLTRVRQAAEALLADDEVQHSFSRVEHHARLSKYLIGLVYAGVAAIVVGGGILIFGSQSALSAYIIAGGFVEAFASMLFAVSETDKAASYEKRLNNASAALSVVAAEYAAGYKIK